MNANKMTQKSIEAVQNAQSLCSGYQNNAIEPVHILTALGAFLRGQVKARAYRAVGNKLGAVALSADVVRHQRINLGNTRH